MMRIVLLFAAVVAAASAVPQPRADCYAEDPSPYLYFGSKTSYQFIGNSNVDPISLPGCKPLQMWLWSRHGTRYPRNQLPNENELEEMYRFLPALRDQVIVNHQSGQGTLCPADLNGLRDWVLEYDLEEENKLTPAGEKELQDLGERYVQRLPDLLGYDYNEDRYEFRYTTASRTEKSCKAFARGVFGSEAESSIDYPEPIESDPLLLFEKSCTKWLEEVENNPQSLIEKKLFERGIETNQSLRAISDRLGFRDQLSIDVLKLAYSMCRYDKAINYTQVSPWCAAFSESDLIVFEYLDDLDYYYKDGYGFEINWKQACNPVVDLISRFNAISADTSSGPYAYFYCSHSGVTSKLLARLGLYNDSVPLTASNYGSQQDRTWRTSRILNFATNLVFVLFDCEATATFKVQAYHNERLVDIVGCSEPRACPYVEFTAMMQPIIDSCDFDAICENDLRS